MTKEAEITNIAHVIESTSDLLIGTGANTVCFSDRQRTVIIEALRAAASPSSSEPIADAGLIEREAIKKAISDGRISWKMRLMDSRSLQELQDESSTNNVLALLSTRTVAREPVAWFHDDFGAVELSRTKREGWRPLYATAALSGRDPATTEPVAWRWKHVNDALQTWNYQDKPCGTRNEYLVVEALYADAGCNVQEPKDVWNSTKHDEIIKRLMNDIGQPNSRPLYQAFKQFANELHALAGGPWATPRCQGKQKCPYLTI